MNIEEKAKRYAQSVVDESVENYIGDEIYNSHIEYASQCYTAGYTQAITDLSTENAQLRDALSLIVELTDDMENAKNDFEYNIRSAERKVLIAKSKQLLTDNTQEK